MKTRPVLHLQLIFLIHLPPRQRAPNRLAGHLDLLEAVLLQTLTDTFGSSAVSLRPLIDQISRMVRKGVLPETIVDEKVLVLSRPHGAEAIAIAQVKPKDLGKYVMDSDLDVHMIVNVNRLFDPLPYKWEDALQGETLLSRHQKAEMLRKPKRGRR